MAFSKKKKKKKEGGTCTAVSCQYCTDDPPTSDTRPLPKDCCALHFRLLFTKNSRKSFFWMNLIYFSYSLPVSSTLKWIFCFPLWFEDNALGRRMSFEKVYTLDLRQCTFVQSASSFKICTLKVRSLEWFRLRKCQCPLLGSQFCSAWFQWE